MLVFIYSMEEWACVYILDGRMGLCLYTRWKIGLAFIYSMEEWACVYILDGRLGLCLYTQLKTGLVVIYSMEDWADVGMFHIGLDVLICLTEAGVM